MEEISPEIAARRDAYVEQQSIDTEGLLGQGMDGIVWHTSRRSALKVHRHRDGYNQERNVYLRLQKHSVHKLAGFSIPILLHYDDDLFALELSIVDRPFVLDFAEATIDVPNPEFEDSAWLREKSKLYGKDWAEVQQLLDALRQYGIFFRDVHSQNISLRP